MQQPVTQLLAQWRDGDERAFAQLSALMYEELRQLAQRHLRRERSNHTMQKTALVNEAFVRLVGQQSVDWQSRAHFIGLASKLMRRVLVDYAQMTPQATAFILNGRGSSHLLLGDAAAALHDFSRAETIIHNGPQPQPTDIAEIRTLPGVTYANLARATAAMAQQSSTPKHLRQLRA